MTEPLRYTVEKLLDQPLLHGTAVTVQGVPAWYEPHCDGAFVLTAQRVGIGTFIANQQTMTSVALYVDQKTLIEVTGTVDLGDGLVPRLIATEITRVDES